MALQMFTTFNASNVTFSDVRKNAKGGKAGRPRKALRPEPARPV